MIRARLHFSNFGSLKSTETAFCCNERMRYYAHFSNFGSLKSTETSYFNYLKRNRWDFSNFGSLKSTETRYLYDKYKREQIFQQFRLVEEH